MLRALDADKLGLDPASVVFENGKVRAGGKSVTLAKAAADGDLVAEDLMEYGDLAQKYQQSTFGAHFVEAAVAAATGAIRVRRMLDVCAAGRIPPPTPARGQAPGPRP